ncbi:MAG: protein-glutamate O-methyltransferase CheR [Ignavibacteria bacterium]|nr:protein-glutamate O-methyltransferase CheR [Ignavibacteria bacterium]
MEQSIEAKYTLTDEGFKELRDIIYKTSGIYYSESKKYLLESRILKRIQSLKLNSLYDYVNFIKNPANKGELKNLFDAITINETYFFRAEQQFDALEKIIIPELIRNKSPQMNPVVIRIWSAACSTGEEPYTIAMIITEKVKPIYPNVQFQILGSDISSQVLEVAQSGIYKEYSVRNMPEVYLKKYFVSKDGLYYLKDEIKKLVRFSNINLFDASQMKLVSNCDVIFCANVLIYFDIPAKQKVVSYLFDALNPGGYLFIGYSESLHGISKAFKLVHLPKAIAYKKE